MEYACPNINLVFQQNNLEIQCNFFVCDPLFKDFFKIFTLIGSLEQLLMSRVK